MNLYETREAIRIEMAKPNPDDARLTALILHRDALRAAEPARPPMEGAEWEARMLDALHA